MNRNIDIYVDQINLITFLIILFKYNIRKINRIIYDSYFLPSFFKFFWKDIKIRNINDFPVSRIKINNNLFFYNAHWNLVNDTLHSIFTKEKVLKLNENFIKKNNINLDKYTRHLREKAVSHIYLPTKMILFAKRFSKKRKIYYITSKNPINFLIEDYFKIRIKNYLNPFNHTFNRRKVGVWDNDIHYRRYNIDCLSPRISILRKMIYFYYLCIKGVFKKANPSQSKKICIELHQREINLKDITDLYWAKYSKTKKENMIFFSYVNWNENSSKILREFGVENINASTLPISIKDFIKIILLIPRLTYFFMKFYSFDSWQKFNNEFFLIKLIYYNSIYSFFNINFLFSMTDFDDDKFIKSQAIENNNGLTSSSHWSNVNINHIIYQKFCDILFTWSSHFQTTFYYDYSYLKTYYVGYPNDHTFNFIERLKKDNTKKYAIGYMDNIVSNDLNYHSSHIKRVYKMFFELLHKYPNIILFTKPKTKYYYEEFLKQSSEMQRFVEEKRIVAFFGSTNDLIGNVKMSPAKFSNICNLVISQGLSSAGAEAAFFGAKSFHYDNSELSENNEFGKVGLNKVVFEKIENLKFAIEKEINSQNDNLEEIKRCHSVLDKYQDGKSGKRTALIIDTIYENFDCLKNIDKTLAAVEKIIAQNNDLFKENY